MLGIDRRTVRRLVDGAVRGQLSRLLYDND